MNYEIELYDGKNVLINIHTGEYLRYHPRYPGQSNKSDETDTADIKQAATVRGVEDRVGWRLNVKVGADGDVVCMF